MSTNPTEASANPPAAITTDQAIIRARTIIEKAANFHHSVQGLVNAEDQTAHKAAENVNNYHLLKYQVATTPDVLWPVLAALLSAAEAPDASETS